MDLPPLAAVLLFPLFTFLQSTIWLCSFSMSSFNLRSAIPSHNSMYSYVVFQCLHFILLLYAESIWLSSSSMQVIFVGSFLGCLGLSVTVLGSSIKLSHDSQFFMSCVTISCSNWIIAAILIFIYSSIPTVLLLSGYPLKNAQQNPDISGYI